MTYKVMYVGMSSACYNDQIENMMKPSNVTEMHSSGIRYDEERCNCS